MNVLILFSTNKIGGAERSLSRMAGMPSSVTYFLGCCDEEGGWNKWANDLGLQAFAFGSNTLTSLIRVLLFMRSNKIDIIYVCGLRLSIFLRVLLLFSPRTKLVHGVRWNPNSTSALDRVFRMVEKHLGKLNDYWITNSEAAKQTLVGSCDVPDVKTLNIYNGIEISPRLANSCQESYLNVITVANLSPRKGHIEFLQAILNIRKVIHDVHFTFLGNDYMDGEVHKEVVRLGLSQVVSIEGFKEDVSEWLDNSAVFVLPSLWGEGCPTSILEAFSYRVPAIAYAIDGVPELIDDGEDGILVSPGNSYELESAVISLLQDNETRRLMGNRGYEKVGKYFSLEKCANEHEKIFQDLTAICVE